MQSYDDFFKQATGYDPFPWQLRMAQQGAMPEAVTVPTGMGKTAGVVVAWLWRTIQNPGSVPRRLVYCLPMRVLVEQTESYVKEWIERLGIKDDVECHVLMGGHTNSEWDRRPEKTSILIGTQDMLLSRALNRGYATSRFRWPVHFALLNNDSFWVLDEVQLMGVGLQTSLQLHAFRENFGHSGKCGSTWMSATMVKDWLETVDHSSSGVSDLRPEADDYTFPIFKRRYDAKKSVAEADAQTELEKQILREHVFGTLTLVIRNTVGAAQDIYKKLLRHKPEAEVLLLHSRFRKSERYKTMQRVYSDIPMGGRILVATQVVEAGMDISAKTMFTDAAPWASMVQRFGRCNRAGEYEEAKIFWIRPAAKKGATAPYSVSDVESAVAKLERLNDAGLHGLPDFTEKLKPQAVVRKRDITDLFDTTPDLAGMDIDISRFVRSTKGKTAFVFWRDTSDENLQDQKAPDKNELCRVPLSELEQKYFKKDKNGWVFDHISGEWMATRTCSPGMIVMLDAAEGGYSQEMGWYPNKSGRVEVLSAGVVPESNDDDPHVDYPPQTIACHTDNVVETLKEICRNLGIAPDSNLITAARWHDAGKSHWAFQKRMGNAGPGDQAKGAWVMPRKDFPRKGFRHELASALALLENGGSDLAAYLVAAHHGKVRMSIRSLPGEEEPKNGGRHARGIHEGDALPEVDLGGGVTMPETTLSLELMELGVVGGRESWLSRTLRLREEYGPFRLAFLESLLRISDWRGSERGCNDDE